MKRPSKYRNKRTVVDGLSFDSLKEARRWGELKLLERAGRICDLRRQVRYPLAVNGHPICVYVADHVFRMSPDAPETIEDVKGVRTEAYRLKKKLMFAVHGIDIQEV